MFSAKQPSAFARDERYCPAGARERVRPEWLCAQPVGDLAARAHSGLAPPARPSSP